MLLTLTWIVITLCKTILLVISFCYSFAFAVVKAEMVDEIMKKSGEKLNNKKIKISRATAEKRQPWDLGMALRDFVKNMK